jgi:CHAD domain-containing protein
MHHRSKWLGQISADDSISKAARITLQSRLPRVLHFLDLAAHHADTTPEYVHQLRVHTRRSLAALRMYQEVLPGKEAKWLRKRLRCIRQAAGEARDLDVFLQRYGKPEDPDQAAFLRRVKKQRRQAQRPITALDTKLVSNGRLEKNIHRLLKKSARHRSRRDHPLVHWARDQIARTSKRLFKAIPGDPQDFKALHRFRVRSKQLRYTMELLSTLFPPEFRTSIYPMVTELQNRLGELNDHATACRHLEAWCNDVDSKRETDYLRRLISQEREQLQSSIEQFGQWWTPEFAHRLDSALRAMTARTDSALPTRVD